MTEQQVTPVFKGSDIVFSVTGPNGKDEADEFLRTIAPADQARFDRYFRYLQDGKRVKTPENMRHIKGVKDPEDKGAEVHEFKIHRNGGLRLFVVKYSNRWYLTHGGKKVSERAVPKEASKAYVIFWHE